MPTAKAIKNAKIMPTGLTVTLCPPKAISPISIIIDKKIIGSDIRKENFAHSFLSPPLKSPAHMVVPEREMPGKNERPCAMPMISAFFFVKQVALLGDLCVKKSKPADTKKQTAKYPPPNEALTSGIKTSTIMQVGMVARHRFMVCGDNGCFII